MNGAASAGSQRMALERAAVPDEAGRGEMTGSAERLAVIVPAAVGQFFVLVPLAYNATDPALGATNARLSTVRVADFPLSSLSRGPPDYRF